MAVWYREDPIRNFSLKYLFYLKSAKIEIVKMIFNVFLLVLKTTERRK